MNNISPMDFYNKTINKSIDVDKRYGAQCWDLFAYFTESVYNKTFECSTTGYVKDLWNDRNTNGILTCFQPTSLNSVQNGDWVVWGDCEIAPHSHIAMYYNGSFLGQNQNNIPRVTLIKITTNGVIGVLRPNIYINQSNFNNTTRNSLHNIGDIVNFNVLYTSSTSTSPVKSLYHQGKITKILTGKPNPYLINNNMGWLNDQNIITTNQTVTVKNGTWNIRTGPSLTNKIVKIVNGGTKLQVIGQKDNWYQTALGYISKYATK